jgi:hypothetical protein
VPWGKKYDWAAIQQFHEQDHSIAECSKVFGFSPSAWDEAARRGDVHYIAPARPVEPSEKRCPKCERLLPIDHFHRDGNRHHSYCKDCQRVLRSNSYYKKRSYYQSKVKQREVETNRWLQEYKRTLRCVRCGFSHPAAIQFHHRDPQQKDVNLSVAARKGWGKERLMEELEKCDPLCANCHFILHWEQRRSAHEVPDTVAISEELVTPP